MELQLIRDQFAPNFTGGKLAINGVFECYSLEDTWRSDGVKVAGSTAIPCGRYEIVITYSQRFNRLLPLLLGVPNFEGVRIHPGNTSADTEGCVLVGRNRGVNYVGESQIAFGFLFKKIYEACLIGKVYITVENAIQENAA